MCAAHFPTAILRRTQAGSWSSLAGQPGLLGQLQARETICFSNWKKKNLELSSGFHMCLGTRAHIYVHVYLYNAHRETISMVLISHNSDTFEGHSHFTNEKN